MRHASHVLAPLMKNSSKSKRYQNVYDVCVCACDDKLARIMIERARNVFWLIPRKCEFKFKWEMSRLVRGVRRLLRMNYVEWPIMHFIIYLRASFGSGNKPLWDLAFALVLFSVWFRFAFIWWWSWWDVNEIPTHFYIFISHFLPEEWVFESYICSTACRFSLCWYSVTAHVGSYFR